MFTTFLTPASWVAIRSAAVLSKSVATVPESVTVPFRESTRMSRAFKVGSLKNFAWMLVVIALSSVEWKNLEILHAPRRSTPVTNKIARRSCDLGINLLPRGNPLRHPVLIHSPPVRMLVGFNSGKQGAGIRSTCGGCGATAPGNSRPVRQAC
jgi:hypothetical protein